MRQCPKCNKTYDDTWKLCLICNESLNLLEGGTGCISETEKLIRCGVDSKKLTLARSALKRDLSIFGVLLSLLITFWILSAPPLLAYATAIILIVYLIIVHYRMFRICREMKEGAVECYLSIFMGWIVAIPMLYASKKMLKNLNHH